MADGPDAPPGPGAPPPTKPARGPRKARPLIGALNLLLGLVLTGAVILAGLVVIVERAWRRPGPLIAETVVTIPPGESLAAIARRLGAAGAIEHPRLFELRVRADGSAAALKAGEYALPAGISAAGVAALLREGRGIVHLLTIPEGWSTAQILARVAEEPKLTGDLPPPPGEGTLLPQTYGFSRGVSRAALIARMQSAMDRALAEAWAAKIPDHPLRSPAELLTLASIVEKETGVARERPQVAGVFVNRLRVGMRLQADATIVYGLTGGRGPLGRELLFADLRQDGPYNSYTRDGLPPGPIANPGVDALMAAARPASHGYLFYVADGTGGHAFAETLEQHNLNVARWNAIEAAAQRRAPDSPSAATGP